MDFEERKAKFLKLLDEGIEEQAYQDFLEQNTPFIPREFVQNHGIGLGLVLRKLPFGSDYKTDFFYFSKSSDDWNAVFIELEKPTSRFFKGNTNEFHGDFLRAQQQINQWRAWFLSDQNKSGFWQQSALSKYPSIWRKIRPTTNSFSSSAGARSTRGTNIAGGL